MNLNTKILAIIPARAGSKGLPGKNIRPLDGLPLIGWSMKAAKESRHITDCVVSTDGADIAKIARELGGEAVIRPAELAADNSLPKDAVLQVLDSLAQVGRIYEYVVLLQPTSPLRIAADIDACVELVHQNELDSAASFMKCKTNPHRAFKIERGRPDTFIEGVNPWQPRQALPKSYELNGAVYVVNVKGFKAEKSASFLFGKTGATVMPEERSHDIDTLLDFVTCEALLTPEFAV